MTLAPQKLIALESYEPTADEYARARVPSDELKLSGDGIFATLQGEGVSAGRPSVFVRLQNCNLHCGQDDEGWKCDAWYTWDQATPEYWQETRLAKPEAIAEEVAASWQTTFTDDMLQPNVVITGGEPLLQQAKVARLLKHLPGWHSEIETNGTVVPIDALRDTQINCSPKLSSSGNDLRARRRVGALQRIATFPDHYFKFVISDLETDIPEVEEVVDIATGGDFSRVFLMSEGVVGSELTESDLQLHEIAKQLGCMVTARNHIFWYGDKRAT